MRGSTLDWRSVRRNLLVLISFVLITCVLFWPVFLGKVNINGQMLVSLNGIFGENIAFKPIGTDQLRIYYPSLSFTVSEFKKFRLPLWNPYSFAGQPNVGELQSAVFNPINVFSLILPFNVFWNFLRVAPSVLAAFFMYLYLKRLKLSGLAAFFGAISWGFSPFILTWGEEQVITPYAVAWLPLALFGIEGLKQTKPNLRRLSLGLIALSVAGSLLAGFIQLSFYLAVLVVLYGLCAFGFAKKFLLVTGAVFLGVGLAAVQLVPAVELFLDSPRSTVMLSATLYKFLLPAYSVASYMAPDIFGSPATYNFFREGAALYYEGILYGGIAVLVFAIFAVGNVKERLVGFFATVFFVSLILTIDSPLARAVMGLPIPILSSSIANRILFVPAFCLVMLGSMGYNHWLNGRSGNIKKVLVYLFLIYLALFLLSFLVKTFSPTDSYIDFFNRTHGNIALRNLLVPFLVFLLTAFLIWYGGILPKYKRWGAVLIILIAALHTFYFASKFFNYSEVKFVFPQTKALAFLQDKQGVSRVWAHGNNRLENNFPQYYQLNWPEGYKSLFIRSYWELAGNIQKQPLKVRSRADVGLGSQGQVFESLGTSNRRRLIDLVGVKYIVGDSKNNKVYEKYNLTKVFEAGDKSIFENAQAVPRIYLASNYEGPPDIFSKDEGPRTKDEIAKIEAQRRELIPAKLREPNFDWRNTIILEKPSPISPQFGAGSVKILIDEPGEIIVKTSSVVPKLLYVADNYYPGWKATVDGNETEILRANYTFRAVPLTPGEHVVRMEYDPWSFKAGLGISVASIGIIVLAISKKSRLI